MKKSICTLPYFQCQNILRHVGHLMQQEEIFTNFLKTSSRFYCAPYTGHIETVCEPLRFCCRSQNNYFLFSATKLLLNPSLKLNISQPLVKHSFIFILYMVFQGTLEPVPICPKSSVPMCPVERKYIKSAALGKTYHTNLTRFKIAANNRVEK